MPPSKDVYNRRADFARLVMQGASVREAAELLAPRYKRTVSRLIDDWSNRRNWGLDIKEKRHADKVIFDHRFALQMIRRELWTIVDDETGQYSERVKLAALKEIADLEFKGLKAAQSLGLAYTQPVKVEETVDARNAERIKRIQHLMLRGELRALYDVYNDDPDFERKYDYHPDNDQKRYARKASD